MCGLIGRISPASVSKIQGKSIKSIVSQLLYVGALRGFDSTGVFAVNTNRPNVVEVHKKAEEATNFIVSRKFQKILDRADALNCIIGHNRAATRGGITDSSAHPFVHGNIALVHNGTLDSNPDTGNQHFVVDSEAICYALSRCNNVKETEEVLKDLEGAFALIWWDSNTRLLNIIRNTERTLAWAKDKDGILYIASEIDMLKWVLNRNHVLIETCENIADGQWITVDAQGDELDIKTRAIELKPPFSKYDWVDYSRTGSRTFGTHYQETFRSSQRPLFDKIRINPDEPFVFIPRERVPISSHAAKDFRVFHMAQHMVCKGTKYTVLYKYVNEDFFNMWKDKDMLVVPTDIYYDTKNGGKLTIAVKMHTEQGTKPVKLLEGPNNTVVLKNGYYKPLQEVEKSLADGCQICGADLHLKDLEYIEWFNAEPVCPACSSEQNMAS